MLKQKVKRILEVRALPNETKELEEQRADFVAEMNKLVDDAKEEKRALTDEEDSKFNEITKKIEQIDKTIKADETRRAFENTNPVKKTEKQKNEEETRALDEEKFLKFVRGEERALDTANNGGIIPTTIANKIIEKVKELSPIYAMATIYNVSGDLVFPYYDETTSSIKATYTDDLQELTEGTGKFTTVKLQNFIVGCLAKVSKSLINRTDFDLVSFIITKVATAISEFLEKELIQGTTDKMSGLSSTTNLVTAASSTGVTADELIELQMTIPEVYQTGAVWIMHKDSLKFIRKLKDGQGNYLLGTALNGFGFTLLGKPVHFTESADKMQAGKKAIYYGDMSGLYVKLAQNVEIQVLMEKYATQHAIGVVGYVECDSKIVEAQKIAALTMKAGA